MKAVSLEEELKKNAYPGRGIILGRTPDGKKGVAAYFIMGRSANSRNRVFVEDGDGIRTQAFDESRMELAGEMTGRRYRLGQKLRIYVSGADKMSRTIDFLPAEDETEEEDEKQGREGGWPKKASS